MAAPEAVKHTDLWWQTVPNMQFASLFSNGMWMYSGFLSNSSLSGEVKKGALLKGQLVALGIDWLLYVVPICAVMHVQPNWAKWDSGYLGTAFGLVNPALGTVIAFAGAASGIGLYLTSLTCYCRTMWGVADLGWLPAVFRRKNRYNVPWVTLTLQLATTALLCLFSFDFLVTVEFCFATFMYLLFVASFLRLRWTEPDAPRGYRVPGNNLTAVLIGLPLAVFVGGAFGSTIVDWRIACVFVGFLVLLGLIYFFVVRPQEKTIARVASFHDEDGSPQSVNGRASRAYLDS
jgi:amino acid transporter